MPPRRRQPAASDPPPPLPGGYKVGEKVFFTGANQTFADGSKLVHSQQGEVTGPATNEATEGKGVEMRFPSNKVNINCFLHSVRRLRAASAATPPPGMRPTAHATQRRPRPEPAPALPRYPLPHPQLCKCSRARAVAQSPWPWCGVRVECARASGF